ncbi:MAG: Gfo/Idh/MocA family oxidoreductase [Deltaproteobacteria bacterium]|nr:Gfo/Idh/MocA family oxidoreductase [Deltaproteobacteria bacterium]
MSALKKVRVACVGAGYWGKNLVRNFATAEGAELVCVCDRDEKLQARARREYPGVKVHGDYQAVLESPEVDAVVLATPGATHAELVAQALDAGKDVFVEKPLAQTVADARRVSAQAQSAGRVLMVGHLMLYHPAFLRAREYVRSGELGEVLYIYASRVNLGKVRHDENALWSLGPHDFSMIFALVDAPLASVSARGHAYLRPGTEDIAFVNALFKTGVMANVHLSWLDPHKHRQLTVVGSRKMLVFDDTHPTEKLRIHDKGFDRPLEYHSYDAFLTLRDGDILIPSVPMEEPLRLEVKHFLECVRGREAPRTGGPEGVKVVEALAAAEASMRRHGAPIVLA